MDQKTRLKSATTATTTSKEGCLPPQQTHPGAQGQETLATTVAKAVITVTDAMAVIIVIVAMAVTAATVATTATTAVVGVTAQVSGTVTAAATVEDVAVIPGATTMATILTLDK